MAEWREYPAMRIFLVHPDEIESGEFTPIDEDGNEMHRPYNPKKKCVLYKRKDGRAFKFAPVFPRDVTDWETMSKGVALVEL